MDERKAFDIINGILDETDYPVTIRSVNDIEDFLLDDSNRRFTAEYPVIGRIYDDLRGSTDVDRYSEPALGYDEEEHHSAFNANTEINPMGPT